MKIKTLLALFFASVFLCACGGGGDGSGSSFQRSGVEADITPENAELIAASTTAAVAEIAAAALLSGESGILLDYRDSSNYMVTIALRALSGSSSEYSAAASLQPLVVIGPDRQQCLISGFITVSADIRDPNAFANGMLSEGDEIFADFQNCNDGEGIVLNGGFDFIVTRFEGNIFGTITALGMDIHFANLRISEDGPSVTFDGAASLLNVDEETTISGNTLLLTAQGVAWEHREFTQTTDETGPGYSITAAGMLETTLYIGSITYSTPVPIASTSDSDPETGEMLITGQGIESILLTYLGQGVVQLEVDADGDGEFDSAPIVTTLEALGEVLSNAINN
jgi:hypothetical protein